MIFCYDIENGELLWEKDVTGGKRLSEFKKEPDKDTGYAAPTPVVDGRHVYAMFANGELVAVDLNGKFVWRKSFGIPENHYGYASSPALYFDRLIVQFDDGTEVNKKYVRSKLYALDLSTGDVLWEVPRDMGESWASPTIKKIGDSYQIITCAAPFAIAYNPEDGKEIWRCECLGGDVGPSAVSLGNVVLITNTSPRTSAIDATGLGDVTETHVLWRGTNSLPDTVSPLITDEYILTLHSDGYLTGYNPKDVKLVNNTWRASYWELELEYPVSIYSSPLRVGNHVYIFDKSKDNSKSFVIDLSKIALDNGGRLTEEAKTAMILSENPMPEPCVTSPAVLNNRLYIRGEKMIYCIGEI
jgi:outer membrane protein assembly factor BamB